MILDPLTVYAPTRPKVRVGRAHDGGYVIAAGIDYDHFLSGGIADDNSFERCVLDLHPELTCDAYDPHSEGGVTHPRLRFHRAILGYCGLGAARNALVKIDIEGDEWPWLAGLTASRHIAQFVIELHSPHLGRWDWKALARLAETHYLIHAHGNNWGGLVDVDGVRIPRTIECTWVRKDLDPDLPKSRAPIPSPLDMPNRPDVPDHVIDWPPFVNPEAA